MSRWNQCDPAFLHAFLRLLIIQGVSSRQKKQRKGARPSKLLTLLVFGKLMQICFQYMEVLVFFSQRHRVDHELWCDKYGPPSSAIRQDVLSRLPEPWDVAKVQVEMMMYVRLCWVWCWGVLVATATTTTTATRTAIHVSCFCCSPWLKHIETIQSGGASQAGKCHERYKLQKVRGIIRNHSVPLFPESINKKTQMLNHVNHHS